jgi:DNA polymerase-3 subunit alpha
VDARTVDQIFEQFEPFARYGFNRAHAACYGLIAYYTAYLKAHYAAEYMTALLSSDVGNMDRVAQAVAECARMDLNVLPPDVNESAASFTTDGKVIRFGLTAVRNVGVGAIEVVIAVREAGGPFASLADFCGRVDTRQVNQRVIASLIKAGAFDRLGSRAQMLQTLDAVLERGQRSQRARNEAQTGLFGDLGASPEQAAAGLREGETAVLEFTKEELLTMEREMLGLYISDHPLRRWAPVLAQRATATIAQLADLPDRREVTVGGLIGTVKRSMTRSGSTMAFVTLEDLTGSIEVLVFPRAYEQHGLSLKRDAVVLLRGKLDVEEQSVKLLCDEVIALPPAPPDDPPPLPGTNGSAAARNGRPTLRVRVSTIEEIEQLERYLKDHPGTRRVCAHVVSGDGEHVVPARSGAHDIEELQQSLEQLFGEGNVWEE